MTRLNWSDTQRPTAWNNIHVAALLERLLSAIHSALLADVRTAGAHRPTQHAQIGRDAKIDSNEKHDARVTANNKQTYSHMPTWRAHLIRPQHGVITYLMTATTASPRGKHKHCE